jgi:zinc-ribbon domain
MICPRCQAAVAENASFCTNCGAQFGGQSAPTGAAPQPPPPPPPGPGYGPPQQGHPQPHPGSAQAPPGYSQPPPGYSQPQQGYPPQQQGPGYGPPGQQQGYRPPGQYQTAPAGPAFSFDLRRLNRVDQVIGVASLILIITLFLPWFGLTLDGVSASVSGFSAHGYLIISLLTAVVLIGYLVMRAGWDDPPMKSPVAHAPLLLVLTGLQLLIVLIAFLFKPDGLGWQFGAWLGLLAALVACGAIVMPAIQSMQAGNSGS